MWDPNLKNSKKRPEPPPMSRSRSQHVAQTALETIRAQKGQLVDGGLSRANFFVGVMNVLLTTLVIGRYPQHYWLYHTAKSVVLLPARTVGACQKRRGLWMAEFCWVANYSVLFASLYVALTLFVPGIQLVFSDETVRSGWLLFFMIAAGPLGCAIPATGNALVFHSFNEIAALFIHSSPLLTAWCIQTDLPAFRSAYPDLLRGIESHSPDVLREMLLPAVSFYLLWWVPYSVWLLVDGLDQPTRGNATVYQPLEAAVMKVFPWTKGRPRLAAVHYLMGHLLGSCASFGGALLAFHSKVFFTAYCGVLLTSAVWKGSSKYNYYLLDVYEKKVTKALEQGEEGNSKVMI